MDFATFQEFPCPPTNLQIRNEDSSRIIPMQSPRLYERSIKDTRMDPTTYSSSLNGTYAYVFQETVDPDPCCCFM